MNGPLTSAAPLLIHRLRGLCVEGMGTREPGRDALTSQHLSSQCSGLPLSLSLSLLPRSQDAEALCRQTAGWGVPVSVSLSLDSVCPYIIFESADIDSAVDGVMETVFKKRREVLQIMNDIRYISLCPYQNASVRNNRKRMPQEEMYLSTVFRCKPI